MKKYLLFLLMGILVIFSAACGNKEAGTTDSTGGNDDGIVIGAAMPDNDDKWLTYLQDGMKETAESENVELIFADAMNDASKQLSQVENFVSQKVDAIMMVPVDTTSASNIVDIANNADIPIIVVNRFYEGVEDATAFVGSDSMEAGLIQMEEVANLMDGKGKIAIMDGTMGHDAQIKRTQGNKDIIKKFSDMEVVLNGTGDFDRAKGMALMENWLQSGTEINAVVANNDEMAIGAIMALEDAGKLEDVVVAGIDATPDALEYVKSGKLEVTVFQDATGQGKGGVEAAIKAAKGEELEKLNFIPYELVTKENVEEFIAKWN